MTVILLSEQTNFLFTCLEKAGIFPLTGKEEIKAGITRKPLEKNTGTSDSYFCKHALRSTKY